MSRLWWVTILACALVLGFGGTALAYQNQLAAGDPAWVLDGLAADQVEVSIRSLDGQYGKVTVDWKCSCQTGDWQRSNPVNVFGPGTATMTLQKPGCRVERVSFTCEKGSVTIQATGSGGGY